MLADLLAGGQSNEPVASAPQQVRPVVATCWPFIQN